jgi:hypothetical protein
MLSPDPQWALPMGYGLQGRERPAVWARSPRLDSTSTVQPPRRVAGDNRAARLPHLPHGTRRRTGRSCVAAQSMVQVMKQYTILLKGVLVDNDVSPAERDVVMEFAREHHVSNTQHMHILNGLGWTMEQVRASGS